MKIEIGQIRPDHFQADFPEQFNIFSHFEFACGIPQLLFAVTTCKKNGQPNVCYHSWSCFQGDGSAYYALLAGIYQHTHTYANICRTGEFCVNFLPRTYHCRLLQTIAHNHWDEDEFAAGKFTIEEAVRISAPRIKESFLCLECKQEQTLDLSGAGLAALVVGKVLHIAVDDNYANGHDRKYGADGFMYNIHSPQNLHTGRSTPCAVTSLELLTLKE